MRLFFSAAALVVLIPSAFAADPSGQWLNPPAQFLVSNYVKSTRAPLRKFEIVLDLPQGATKKTKPAIARSSGDAAVDAVAIRYVQLALERSKTAQAQVATKSARFQVRLQAGALDPKSLPKHLQRPSEKVNPNVKVDFPPPRLAFSADQNVAPPDPLLLRLKFPAAGGMPDEAILVRSSGQIKVDAAVLLYALANARGKAADAPYTMEMPVVVGRSLEPSEFSRPENFPTNSRTF